jgi:hypothetical protein
LRFRFSAEEATVEHITQVEDVTGVQDVAYFMAAAGKNAVVSDGRMEVNKWIVLMGPDLQVEQTAHVSMNEVA